MKFIVILLCCFSSLLLASTELPEKNDDPTERPIKPASAGSQLPSLPTDRDNNIEVGLFGVFERPIEVLYSEDAAQVDVGSFDFRVSVGYGALTNPLKKRDDIHIYLLPELSYYGEKFYFENFVVGYSLYENAAFNVDLFGYFNSDGYFFELDGIEKITLGSILNTKFHCGLLTTDCEEKPIERKLSYLGGVNIQYRHETMMYRLSHATDISNVHHGKETVFEVARYFDLDPIQVKLAASKTLKSAKINDYYYLITPGEIPIRFTNSSIGATDTHSLSLQVGYPISEHWMLNAFVKKTWLDKKLIEHSDSVLVEDRDFTTTFFGIGYQF